MSNVCCLFGYLNINKPIKSAHKREKRRERERERENEYSSFKKIQVPIRMKENLFSQIKIRSRD